MALVRTSLFLSPLLVYMLRACGLPWRSQHLFQILLAFVDVSANLPLEGEEGRVCPRGDVAEVSRFPNHSGIIIKILQFL